MPGLVLQDLNASLGLMSRAGCRCRQGRNGPGGRARQGPTITLGYIKKNINNAEHLTLEQCFDGEAAHHSRCGETADHKEAATAFVEKRSPAFMNR